MVIFTSRPLGPGLAGLCGFLFAFTTKLVPALPPIALSAGLGTLFNINTTSLRQSIVPNEMLGRVISIAAVLAWSAIPVGALLGGVAIQLTGNVVLVFAALGVVTMAIPLGFSFTALGHADLYLEPKEPQPAVPEIEIKAG